MDSTISVSKGCFIFKPKDEKKGKGKRKPYNSSLDFSSEFWYQSYSKLWKNIENKLENINNNVSEVVLHDLEQFISNCDMRSKTIPTATLLLGVNLPDHNALFRTLASRLQSSESPHIAILESDNCTTVRGAVEKMASQFLKGDKIQDDEAMEIDFSDSDDEDFKSVKISDCNLPALASWYKDQYKCSAQKKLIVILTDFEGFAPKVLEDFILILSQYVGRLPVVLVMGVATTSSALHRTLPHSVTSQLNIRLFQSKPSVYFLNNTLDNVFLKGDCPFQIGSKLMKFLTDVFLFYDFSVDGFIKGLKYCVMEHFYGSNTSVLCCLKSDVKKVVQSLEKEHLASLKQLPSWQTYFHTLSKEKQAKLKSSSSVMKETVNKLMNKLWEHIEMFYLFLRLLHVLVEDLPNAPLGKQIRELHSEAVSEKVTDNVNYKECFKILCFMSKDELLAKLNRMLDIFHDAPDKGEKAVEIFSRLKEQRDNIYRVGLEPLNRTPSKSPSKKFNITSRVQFREHLEKMSELKKPNNAYEAARLKLLDYLKDEVFEQTLTPLTSLPLHEVVVFDNITAVKRHLIGSPRAAVHTALNNPHHYLQCECCKLSNDGEILPTMPDICIAYKLHLESSSLINMYDWLQSFASVINPDGGAVGKGNKEFDQQIQARFTQAVAELQFLGFIKSSKKKTDHVTRLTWGGST